jgi:hypothetical protein
VSLTSIVAKVLESIVRDAIVEHMMANGLFSDDQHGFVPGRSCMTQLLVVMEEWSQLLNQGLPVDAIYLDFWKAFDTVPHQPLLRKLEAYGVRGKLLKWMFVVFINDMSSGVTSACKLFADDSKIYGPVSTEEGIQAIQKDLTQLVGWSEKWQMGHNVDKFKSLHLGNQNPGHQYTMSGNPLVKTLPEKDLGVTVANT